MEQHILITWEKSHLSVETVREALPESISISHIVDYKWDERYALNNFAAFYGEKLEDIQYKVDHCGSGSFYVYILNDNNPVYEKRVTSSGSRSVNTNLFDTKASLRSITGGGHLVHASDTEIEANLNSLSLFGLKIDESIEYLNSLQKDSNSIIHLERDITGVHGWNSWGELFNTISKLTKYSVLRNISTVVSDEHELHGDTDIIVEDYAVATTIAAGHKEFLSANRVLYSVNISGKKQLIDFRHVGDGYYDEKWEKNLIDLSVEYDNTGIWCLDEENQKYTILYHALIHKPFISSDYKEYLQMKFGTDNRDELRKILDAYMMKMDYLYSNPLDKSVYVNPEYFDVIKKSFAVRVINLLKYFKHRNGKYEGNNKQIKTNRKVLYSGYYLAIKVLRKIKSFIRKILH